jgi:hypothetical protein
MFKFNFFFIKDAAMYAEDMPYRGCKDMTRWQRVNDADRRFPRATCCVDDMIKDLVIR